MTEFMLNSDAFTWSMESDPRLRSTVVTLLMLDRPPDWQVVRRRFDRVSRDMPMFRQRVAESPPPAPPRWEDRPDFDLDFHLRRVTAPDPGSFDTVLEMARVAAMEDFDRARPLWTATLIDGLADGGAAVLCKFHHALTDGLGAIQIGMTLFDLTETPPQAQPLPEVPRSRPPSPLGGYSAALRYNTRLAAAAVSGVVKSVPRLLWSGIARPVDTVTQAAATTASVYRTTRPVGRPGSSLIADRSLVRQLGVHEVAMAPLREAAHRHGGALNDAFVAAVAGGLRRYHEKHDSAVGDLHLSMPVSLRTDADKIGGNRITLMRFDIPVGVVDPGERIAQIRARTDQVRSERSLPHTQTIAGVLNLVPRWYIGSVLRHVDFLCSDVPGIPVPVYLGGAALRTQYAFGPTIGAAVNVTLLTYAGTCYFGLNVDTAAIPDVDVFRACLVDGFDEVLALATDG